MQSAISFGRHVPGLLEELDLPVVSINAGNQPTGVESTNRHGVDVLEMPGVGHFLMLDDLERFNALLADTIVSLRRKPE
jgi:pimeloyl-ACP methyl ester carboxylesterase